MRSIRLLLLCLFVGWPLAACDSSGSSESSGEATEGGGGGEAAGTMVEIPQLNLHIEAPSDARVSNGVGGGAMIQARGLVVQVKEPGQFNAATLEEAQASAQDYSPQNVHTETLEDGWALTFENTGSMGANYFVQVRRTIDGTAYWCETTASSAAQSANALAACKSLTR